MLCHTCAENVTITCTFNYDAPPEKIDILDLERKNELINVCLAAKKISLEGRSTLPLDGVDNMKLFMEWLLMADELDMCLSIENTSLYKLLIFPNYIVGKCKGPNLSIVNNTNLKLISIRNKNFGRNMASVAIRIRGNRKLDADDLKKLEKLRRNVNGNWDLQPVGECTLPKPLDSLEMLDQTCTDFYGPLVMREGIAKFQYDLSKVHKFNLEGCIQIQKTDLRDISFLMAFSRFRRMQSCSQFIRDNKKLCPRNLEYLNVFFEDIQLSNNTNQPCGECIGGFVSEHYLRESVNCSTVYGDLIIANFRGLPPNFENLRGIETIEGRLIITNNTGLHKFDYFTSLKKVGRSNDDVAIIIKDNGDLNIRDIPIVFDIQLKKENKRTEIVNNPMFFQELEKTLAPSTAATKTSSSNKDYEESSTAPEYSEMIGSPTSEKPYIEKINNRIIYGGIAAAASFILLCSTAYVFACQQKPSAVHKWQSYYKPYANTKKKASTNATMHRIRGISAFSATDASSASVSQSCTTVSTSSTSINPPTSSTSTVLSSFNTKEVKSGSRASKLPT